MSVDIIAEIGINHNGNFDRAVTMIHAVKQTGVKIVKFQFYDALKLLGADSPYLAYASSCQFSKAQHEELKKVCDSVDLEYLVSVFDIADIPWADSLCKRHKVASRMNQDNDFINALLKTDKEVIVSTQSTHPTPTFNVRYMFCVTEYPTAQEKLAHLACNSRLGLSSHCPSIAPSLMAVAQGADLIEHHVTFSRTDEGCDHTSSITFEELAQLKKLADAMAALR